MSESEKIAEKNIPARERNLNAMLDMEVQFRFSVNEVRLNSGLNADVLDTI